MSNISKSKNFFIALSLLIILSIYIIFVISKFNKNPTSVIGLWRGFQNETMIVFNLKENSKCSLEFYESNNKDKNEYLAILKSPKLRVSVEGECDIDYTKNPIPIKLKKAKKSSFIQDTNPGLLCNINCSIEPIYFITEISKKDYKASLRMSYFSETKRLNYTSFETNSFFSLFKISDKFSY